MFCVVMHLEWKSWTLMAAHVKHTNENLLFWSNTILSYNLKQPSKNRFLLEPLVNLLP